jgi:hypothetical protein
MFKIYVAHYLLFNTNKPGDRESSELYPTDLMKIKI